MLVPLEKPTRDVRFAVDSDANAVVQNLKQISELLFKAQSIFNKADAAWKSYKRKSGALVQKEETLKEIDSDFNDVRKKLYGLPETATAISLNMRDWIAE